MGITQTLNREMARFSAGSHTPKSIYDLLRSLEIISLVIGLLIVIIVWFLSSPIANYWLNNNSLDKSSVSVAIFLMGIVIALRFFEGIYRGSLLGLQQQVTANLINMFFSTLRFGGVIAVLHFYSATIQAFFVWQIVCSILSSIIFAMFFYKAMPSIVYVPKFSFSAINDVKKFAKGMFLITLLATMLTQIDKLLLSKLVDLTSYGYYTLASSIAAGLGLITIPITQAIYPKLVDAISRNNVEDVARLFHQGARLVSIFTIPIGLVFILFSKEVLLIWSGSSDIAISTANILIPLTIGSLINCMIWMPYQVQLAYGWTSFAIKVNAIAVSILLPSIIISAKEYGVLGAAWTWTILNLGYLTFGMHFMFKKILVNEKRKWYMTDIIKVFTQSFVIFLVSKILIIVSDLSNYTDAFFIITGLLIAVGWSFYQIKARSYLSL